jgi:hypothetical protein
MSAPLTPLVVQYLYVHERGERFQYPTARAGSSAGGVATRYLECALTQAASLRLRDVPCDLALATNITDPAALGRVGAELFALIQQLGVQILPTEYRHRPRAGTAFYLSSRYLLDAMLTATEGQPEERRLWFTDLDCVWADPQSVFDNAPAADEIGCIYIGYPPDWDTVGMGVHGRSRRAMGELAAGMGGSGGVAPWVGGELLSGTPHTLRELVRACEELDTELAETGKALPNEEQILSLAGAVGRIRYRDLSGVARRVPTGPRNRAAKVEDPLTVGLWHLPAEKGLSLRRTARQIRKGRTAALRRDLSDPARAARLFNVAGTGLGRRLQDDGWIATQRVRRATLGRLGPD